MLSFMGKKKPNISYIRKVDYLMAGEPKPVIFIYIYNCTLGSGVHVKNIQDYCIGTHMLWWFAAPITPSSFYGFFSSTYVIDF